MTAPASSDLRELERLLTVAADEGVTMTRAAVQDEFQVSARDADEMLGVLREHGKAIELAPGEWRGPTLDELDTAPAEPPRVEVSLPDGDGDVPEYPLPAHRREMEEAARRAGVRLGATGERVALVSGEPTVRLTMAIAEALDAGAIGAIVKAALDGLEDGEVFVLEVTP